MTHDTILILAGVALVAFLLFIVQPWADRRDGELRRRGFDEAFIRRKR